MEHPPYLDTISRSFPQPKNLMSPKHKGHRCLIPRIKPSYFGGISRLTPLTTWVTTVTSYLRSVE